MESGSGTQRQCHGQTFIKEDPGRRDSRYSSLSSYDNLAHTRYPSPALDPPPPPPAAYTNPADDRGSSYQRASQHHYRQPDTYVDDPIPLPPAKYSYPLPPISEALSKGRHANPAIEPIEKVREYRRYSNDSQSSDRYTQSREYHAERGAVQAPYSVPPPALITSAATSPASSTSASYQRRPIAPEVQAYRFTETQDGDSTSRGLSDTHDYDDPRSSGYRAQSRREAAYTKDPVSSSYDDAREAMPPPPPPPARNASTIYTPSLSNPHTPSSSAGFTSYKPSDYREGHNRKAARPIYGESVKRHLDTFDLENALNLMLESSRELLEFSEYYQQKAHNTQRTGPLPGTTPHIQQIDDMMKHGSRVQQSLNSLREIVTTQQAEAAQQTREKEAKRAIIDEQLQEEPSGAGGFAGSDSKKRRGRAAPPGKCHSCNRVDTPEWRRGPDGARTLCNACGLHYAKLTRKTSVKERNSSSSLQVKEDAETV